MYVERREDRKLFSRVCSTPFLRDVLTVASMAVYSVFRQFYRSQHISVQRQGHRCYMHYDWCGCDGS